MNETFILYFLTFYLFWSLLFVPLLVKNTKKQLVKVTNNPQELAMLHQIADNFSWQRILIDYLLIIKDKTKVKTMVDQVDVNDEMFLNTTLILGKLCISRSLLLMFLSMLLLPLLIISVVGFGSIQNLINKMFAIEKITMHTC